LIASHGGGFPPQLTADNPKLGEHNSALPILNPPSHLPPTPPPPPPPPPPSLVGGPFLARLGARVLGIKLVCVCMFFCVCAPLVPHFMCVKP
jgi:hypothetical protein